MSYAFLCRTAFRKRVVQLRAICALAFIAFAACTGKASVSSSPSGDDSGKDNDDIPVLPPGEGSLKNRTDPGSTGLRRLSKVEYNNTLAHLFGLSDDASALFPSEPSAAGFDNIAKVQNVTATFVSAHAKAVEHVVSQIVSGKMASEAMWHIGCDASADAACAEALLRDLAFKAWRRPPADADVDALVKLLDAAKSEGLTGNEALTPAISAVLMSPRFLFRIEEATEDGKARRLDPYEDATRLSYFLWSSTPDMELLEAATNGELDDRATRRQQIERMLSDQRAKGFVSNFLGQWLFLRNLRHHNVAPTIMKDWSAAMAADMIEETETFFLWALRNSGLQELIASRKAFVSEKLARHYDIAPPAQPGDTATFEGDRQGLLGHASVLTATSHSATTSPVMRGKFILEQLLCEHLPAPPANVSPLDAVAVTGTTRQQLEAHRSDPACAGCHRILDPMGLALETFDAVGRARTEEAGLPIDASGTLPEGQDFANTAEMLALLADDPRLGTCLTQQLYIFALGREVETQDDHMDPAVLESLAQALSETEGRLSDLAIGIAEAPTFQFRRF